jgi:acetyl-CoA decarbonylase/synthase, CODH/ACS complex subunit gamma
MALTGIEIFKLLPKTNCGKCGVPTCLAFAMSLAAGKADLSKCPFVSEESRAKLMEAAAPPIMQVTVGVGERALKIGGETVMYRHEKRFENPPGIALRMTDAMSEGDVNARLQKFNTLEYERVGVHLHPDLVAIKAESGDPQKFVALINKVKSDTKANIILMADNPDMLAAGLKACADRKPLIYPATKDTLDRVAALTKEFNCAIGVKASNLEELAAMTQKLTGMGIKNIVIDSGARTVRQALDDQIIIRSAALNKKFRPLGFPTIVFPKDMTDNPMKEALIASIFVAKYAGIIVLSDFSGESLFPLLVERLNIFTDPQRPLSTKEGIYEINNPNENSPVMITCNFSLTYFIVSGEIENSKVPSYLYIKDTEGLSVMTAWAAGKFSSDGIAPALKKSGIDSKIKHRKLIIPGYLATESGGLEEEMPGWEILVGPRDAANLPAYLKSWKP